MQSTCPKRCCLLILANTNSAIRRGCITPWHLPTAAGQGDGEISMQTAATRYISSFIVEFFSDFMCFAVEQYRLSPDEIAIICLVASESTREIRKDAFATRNFGSEDTAIPDMERPSVSIKFIHTRLGLSRETTRRKVAGLVDQGYVERTRGGVFLPAQTGRSDFTRDLRNFLVAKLEVLNTYRANIPD